MNYYQQGDVLIKETPAIKGKKVVGALLYKSSPTTNPHALSGGKFTIKKDGEKIYLEVTKTTKITHPEHKSFSIAKGKYEIDIVKEYDHFLEESRRVAD